MFSIIEPRFSFVISIEAFEQVEKVANNKTITNWVEGGRISLNYNTRSGIGQYGRVRSFISTCTLCKFMARFNRMYLLSMQLLAKFHGTFESTTEVPNLRHKKLLIPRVTEDNKMHPQIKVRSCLIVDLKCTHNPLCRSSNFSL